MSEAKKLPQYVAAVCICIGAMGTGSILGWTSNISDLLKQGKLNDLKLDDDELGWAGSWMTVGAMLMCLCVGYVADKIGRKPTVLMTVLPFTIGWLLIIFAKHVAMLYAGRFLLGVAGGSFCITAPMYTSEIAQTEIRGRLGTFFQLFITIGILFANIFGWAVPLMLYNLMCMAIPIIFGIIFIFQPESPLYNMRKGKTELATKAFQRLRGKEYNPSEEMKTLQEQITKEENMGSFFTAMKAKAAKKATLICFMLMFYQQLGGINAVIFYSGVIFEDAKSSLPSHWCVIIIGVVQVIATIFSSWSIEKLGRKILLMASDALMSLSTALLGLFFTLKNHKMVDEDTIVKIGFLPILSLIIFIIAFSIGFGPIPWVASSELFPPEVMAVCSSLAGAFNWFLAFLVTRFYLNLANAMGNDITFYIFAVISLTGVFFVLFIVPETKGKSFAEIQEELSK